MKLNLIKDDFLDKLVYASRFTASRFSSLNTLQGILIEGTSKEIHFFSTNLSSYYHSSIKTESKDSFKIVIEPKKVIEFLSLLPAGTIELNFSDKELAVSQGKTKASFSLLSPQDFPQPTAVKEKTQTIKTDVLTKNLPVVLFAASSDETRPVLNGVNFLTQDEEFVLVATDGFRLSYLKVGEKGVFPSMLVPRDFLAELERLVKDQKEVVFGYSAQEKMIMFRVGDVELYSRLIEGDFPPFDKVIPAEKKTTVTLDREELIRAVKLVAVFARDFSNIIVCEFKKEGFVLRPKMDSGETNEVTLDEGKFEGDDQTIAFNFKFLLELLNHLSSKTLTIELLRPDAPVLFRADDNKNFFHIIMPIRIQQ